jgi:hypothetical protein
MHLVRQTKMDRKLLKTNGDNSAVAGRIPPWMVDFGQ